MVKSVIRTFVQIVMYAILVLLICMFFSGHGEFIYEAF